MNAPFHYFARKNKKKLVGLKATLPFTRISCACSSLLLYEMNVFDYTLKKSVAAEYALDMRRIYA